MVSVSTSFEEESIARDFLQNCWEFCKNCQRSKSRNVASLVHIKKWRKVKISVDSGIGYRI
jgi:hypothetical protein